MCFFCNSATWGDDLEGEMWDESRVRGSDGRDKGVAGVIWFRSGSGANPDLLSFKGVSDERIALAVFAD